MNKKTVLSLSFALFFISGLISGCAKPVIYKLSERYNDIHPYTVAVLPVIWETTPDLSDRDVETAAYLFRGMAEERMKRMNYTVVPLEEVDRKYAENGRFAKLKPETVAAVLGVDAVVYIHVFAWNTSSFIIRSAFTLRAGFELFGKAGASLWQATYKTKETDYRFDTAPAELAVIKAYEPRIARLVDALFTTLPEAEPSEFRETFFLWLP